MGKIKFDKTKLSKRDAMVYDAMSEAQKAGYEKKWIQLKKLEMEMNELVNLRLIQNQRRPQNGRNQI